MQGNLAKKSSYYILTHMLLIYSSLLYIVADIWNVFVLCYIHKTDFFNKIYHVKCNLAQISKCCSKKYPYGNIDNCDYGSYLALL